LKELKNNFAKQTICFSERKTASLSWGGKNLLYNFKNEVFD